MNKKNIIIPIAAIIVIATVLGANLLSTEFAMTDQKQDVKAVVVGAMELYDVYGVKSFDMITTDKNYIKNGEAYPFVLSGDLGIIVAHGYKADVVGLPPSGLPDANLSIEQMQVELKENGSVWIQYTWENPDTGDDAPKTSYLVAHEGYVFGSGFYSP